MRAPRHPTLAILPWGNVIEDFLDGIGLDLRSFCEEVSGGWLFNYVSALRLHDWRVVIVCCSRDVTAPIRLTHRATGAPVLALPAWRPYRAIAPRMRNPYAWTARETFGPVHRPLRPLAEAVRVIAPYLATPPIALARALRREGCTAILVQEYEYPRFDVCVALGRLTGTPVFATFQGGDRHNSRLQGWLRPLALEGCRGVVVASRMEAVRLRTSYGLPDDKIAHIGNPLDLDTWSPTPRAQARTALGLPHDARIALWHGRIDIHQKGLDVLLAAWREVIASQPGEDLRLILVGDGRDGDELAARLKSDPLPSLTWHRGYVTDREWTARLLSAADIHVMTSRVEGFPVAALEAMACTLPIVASDIHGLRDILGPGESSGGLLVPPEDPHATADAVIRLLTRPDLRRRLGRDARATVENRFALDTVGGALDAFFKRRVPAAFAAAGGKLTLRRGSISG